MTALVAAFHDGKIRTRARCRTYFRYDWLYKLDNFIWDRADVAWRSNEFAIPAITTGRESHIFSDVDVSRDDLEEWINSALLGRQHKPKKARSSKSCSRAGRKPGSGSYAEHDAPLVQEMKALIDTGKAASPHAAANQIVGKAKGSGTDGSKIRRLVDRFYDEFHSI